MQENKVKMASDNATNKRGGKSFGCSFSCILILVVSAFFMRGCSMDNMESVLEVQRTPLSYVAGLIDGLALVEGQIDREDATLRTILGGTPCVYYSWVKERKTEDDEGNTSWETVDSKSDAVDFDLIDKSGDVLIRNSRAGAYYSRETGSTQYGDFRERENAILHDDTVTVVGYYSESAHQIGDDRRQSDNAVELSVSSLGERGIVSSLGWGSILYMMGAIAAVLLSVYLAMNYYKAHHIMSATMLVMAILPPLLLLQWVVTTSGELIKSETRVYQYRAMVKETQVGSTSSIRHALIKRDANTSAELYEQYRTRYTNILHVWLGGYEQFEPIPYVPGEQAIFKEYPDRPRVGSVLPWWQVMLAGVGSVIAMIAAGRKGYKDLKTKRRIENIPTSPIRGVVPGLTEVVGEISSQSRVINARYSGNKVVYCRYSKQRRVTNSKGKTRWRTVESGVSKVVFEIEDNTGSIKIDTDQATVTAPNTHSVTSGSLRYNEWTLSPGQELYVLGPAVLESLTDPALTIKHSTTEEHFIVSSNGEASVLFQYAYAGLGLLCLSLLGCIGAMIVFYGGASFDAFAYFAAAIGSASFLFLLNLAFMFNDLIFMKNWLSRAKANLNVSLKRRADLIPNLVKIVKTALSFEKDVQSRLTELQGSISGDAATAEPVGELQKRFTALLEEYPQIRTDNLVTDLNNRIVMVENQLEFARTGLNAVTRTHNTRIRKFPDSLMASLMRMKMGEYFQLEHQNEGRAVDVSALLKTEKQKQEELEDQQRQENYENATSEFNRQHGIVIAPLYCIMLANEEKADAEINELKKAVDALTKLEDEDAFADYIVALQTDIKERGLDPVVEDVSTQLQAISGTDLASELIERFNLLAHADDVYDKREYQVVDKFRDALGGEVQPAEGEQPKRNLLKKLSGPKRADRSAEQELLMLTLVTLCSADGEIESSEYESIVDFVLANSTLVHRNEVRKLAGKSLERIKREGLDEVVDQVAARLAGELSSDVAVQLAQYIQQLIVVDGSTHENENKMSRRYLEQLDS